MRGMWRGVFAALCSLLIAFPVLATTYEVGPDKPYTSIGAVPWESLQPGDTVLIHWRSTPYNEKWVICRQGTAAAPITVRGVAGSGGSLPIIDGAGATTRPQLNFWSETRGVIKIGGANTPADTTPKYIVIENLEIRGARTPNTFTADDGSTQSYSANASTIYLEKGENITVRNCLLHDSGNGFFVASSPELASRNILIEGNRIWDNGNVGSIYEHNNYTAAIGITFQYNWFGPLKSGASGNNLKDRSAGLVVRYNWIESGNRQLDLVDGEDSGLIRNDPSYGTTFVYGNILIEPDAAGNRQIVHYGGDSGNTASYRKGTLYFYNNTIVSTRTDRTTLFRLSTNSERADARNNIVYVTAAGNTLSLLDDTGVLDLSHNWFKPGYIKSVVAGTGTLNDDGTSVLGSSPGFVNESGQDFRLAAGSAAINGGTVLSPSAPAVTRQYAKHQRSEARPSDGVLDIGAYELASIAPADLVITTSALPSGAIGVAYSATVTGSGGVTPYNWSVLSGSLPAGLSLAAPSGVISGTPATAGTFAFTLGISDAQSPPDTSSRPFSITIAPADLVLTTSGLPGGTVATPYSTTLSASGGLTPYTWSVLSGSLPAGLSLSPASGVISGTPSAAGTATFTVGVSDSQTPSDTASKQLSIAIAAQQINPVTITTTSLPDARRRKTYSRTLAASGGTTPYSWSIASGSLPPGLSLNAATGTISGQPTALGTFSFTVQVRDSQLPAALDTQLLSIRVR